MESRSTSSAPSSVSMETSLIQGGYFCAGDWCKHYIAGLQTWFSRALLEAGMQRSEAQYVRTIHQLLYLQEPVNWERISLIFYPQSADSSHLHQCLSSDMPFLFGWQSFFWRFLCIPCNCLKIPFLLKHVFSCDIMVCLIIGFIWKTNLNGTCQ